MATGASTADVAILLIDARNGVRAQSKRHARIARLLGITDFVLAINKMDLVDFDRDVFEKIQDDFERVPDRRRGPRHPDERAQRRQRHHPQRPHAVVRRPAAARVPRDRAGASQPAGGAVPLPGAAGASARTTSSAAMPGRSPRARSASATGSPPGRPAAPRASSASSPSTAISRWRSRRCR